MSLGARTFVSFDEADGLGIRAQVIVTVGSLPVKSVSSHGGVAKVEFDHKAADNLTFGVAANVLESAPFYEALVAAAGTGEPVSFRLETQRKNSVDRTFAFPPKEERDRVDGVQYLTTAGGQDVVKKLVEINGVSNEEMRTNPGEDSKWANVPRANVPPFIDSANGGPGATAPTATAVMPDVTNALKAMANEGGYSQLLVGPLAAMAVAAGSNPREIDALVEKACRAAAPKSGVTRGLREAQPWFTRNFDDSRNLGSYEVGAAVGVTGWAEKYLTKALTDYRDKTGKDIDPSPLAEGRLEQVKALAAGVLLVADEIQMVAYGRKAPADRSVTSHGKIRGVVFHVIEDVVSESFAEAVFEGRRQEWFDEVLALAIARYKAAIDVLDNANDFADGLGVKIAYGSHAAPATPAEDVNIRVTHVDVAVEETVDTDANEETAVHVDDLPEPPAEETVETAVETAPEETVVEEPVEEAAPAAEEPTGIDGLADAFEAKTVGPIYTDPDLGPYDKDEFGGEEPSTDDVKAFAKLIDLAGLADRPSVVAGFLNRMFHVNKVEEVHGPRLAAMLNYYRAMGNTAVAQFTTDLNTL